MSRRESLAETIFANALGEMTLKVSKLEEERDRLRALVSRQQAAISRALHHFTSTEASRFYLSRDEAVLALDDQVRDPEGSAAAAWFAQQLEAAREEGRKEVPAATAEAWAEALAKVGGAAREAGRQEIRETAEYRAGVGLRGAAETSDRLGMLDGSLQTGGIAGEKDPNVPEDPRPYFAKNPLAEEEIRHGQVVAGLAPDGLVE